MFLFMHFPLKSTEAFTIEAIEEHGNPWKFSSKLAIFFLLSAQ